MLMDGRYIFAELVGGSEEFVGVLGEFGGIDFSESQCGETVV